MRFSLASAALAALSCSPAAQALHILLNNDDGWASANIRETYRLLKEAGHDVLMVAPVVDNSGQGGRVRRSPSKKSPPTPTNPGRPSSPPPPT